MTIHTGDAQADARLAVLVEKIQAFVDTQLKYAGFTAILSVQNQYDKVKLVLDIRGDNHEQFTTETKIDIPTLAQASDADAEYIIERIAKEFTMKTVEEAIEKPSKRHK